MIHSKKLGFAFASLLVLTTCIALLASSIYFDSFSIYLKDPKNDHLHQFQSFISEYGKDYKTKEEFDMRL
jgi:hypothetical protein